MNNGTIFNFDNTINPKTGKQVTSLAEYIDVQKMNGVQDKDLAPLQMELWMENQKLAELKKQKKHQSK